MTGSPLPHPEPPAEVRRWMETLGGVSFDDDAGALTEGALRALRMALEAPDEDRSAAHALLAADGLLTRAVEVLAQGPDPLAGFQALVDRVAAASVPGDAG